MNVRPRVRADAVFREVAGEWVVYCPGDRSLHALNLTGALVWALCDGEHDVAGIVEGVRSALAEVPERRTVYEDVVCILDEFRDAALLE